MRPRLCLVLMVLCGGSAAAASERDAGAFRDLSLLVSPEYPCTWPEGWPVFQMNPYLRIGKTSAYNSEILTIDPNTGTQMDVPPHSIALPDSGLPQAGATGVIFSERVPAWQFGGEACVIDCQDLIASAPKGRSDLVTPERVMAWEQSHRPLKRGDVVLFRSGYTDAYYKPFPEGRRFLAEPLEGKTPAWPDPSPECMEYLATRGVMHVVVDSPSMGPIPLLQEPVHVAGLRHGMIFTEGATGLGELPATGAFYCCFGPRHAGGAGCEARAFAIVEPELAARLNDAVRQERVVDLSPILSGEFPLSWPGTSVGSHRHPYILGVFGYNPNVNASFNTHILDAHTGTHLVPPAYALPTAEFNKSQYADDVRGWLAEYEAAHGARGVSDVTTEQVPLSQTCGPARVIDVTSLVGSTDKANWPASPAITPAHVEAYEKSHSRLAAGDVVIFHTGHIDRHLKPMPAGKGLWADPVAGKSEGWPAPSAETIALLAARGVVCVATDAPTLGGVDSKQALFTYWMLGTKGLAGVEFLSNVSSLPDGGYFLFAAPKIKGCHGGPGRAIGLY